MMITNWVPVFYVCVVLLFTLPLLPAVIEWWRKEDATPLKVVREYDSNINYFAQTFRYFIEGKFAEFLRPDMAIVSSLQLSLPDGTPFQMIGEDGCPVFSDAELAIGSTSQIIVAKHGLKAPKGMFFAKEVYSREDVIGADNLSFRAILVDADLVLGDDCALIRWGHSKQRIQIGRGANLYGRISAETQIDLGVDTRFGRMFAPAIYFGKSKFEREKIQFPLSNEVGADGKESLQLSRQVLDDSAHRWLIHGHYLVADNSRHDGNLVVQKSLRIASRCHIDGSIKSSGDLYLGDDCIIKGSVVSEGNIYIGQRCQIRGPIIGEKLVSIAADTVVGSSANLTTITAPQIRVAVGVVAFGSVWAREIGAVVPSLATEHLTT